MIVTAQPQAPVKDEVRAAAPDAVLTKLAEGIWRVDGASDPRAAWRVREPIFIRHVQPVDHVVRPFLDDIVACGRELDLDPTRTYSVQTRILGEHTFRPYDLNQAIGKDAGALLDVRDPEQVVSVLVTPNEAYLGLSYARANLSSWAGGEHRLRAEPEQVSRAENKLVEAIVLWRLPMPAGGVAADLGAAPGGWTRILRTHGLQVHAVDPARLDPRIMDDGVTWHGLTVEEWLARGGIPELDVVVADMRMDARDAARVMAPFARLTKPGGWAILTLKLPMHGQPRVAAEALRILEADWQVRGARQLFHNRSEITVALAVR